jgi:hypothetical protein
MRTLLLLLSCASLAVVVGCGDGDDNPGTDGGLRDSGRPLVDGSMAMPDGNRPDAFVPGTDAQVDEPDGGPIVETDGDVPDTDGGPTDMDGGAPGTDGSVSDECPELDLGSEVGEALATGTTVGFSNDRSSSCLFTPDTAPDRAFSWTAPAAGTYVFDTIGTDSDAFDTVLEVLDGTCDGTSLGCHDGFVASRVEVELDADQTVVVVVDGYASEAGDFVLNIHALVEEVCGNGVDDDRDSYTDCRDSDCETEVSCTETGAECADGVDNDGDEDIDCDDSDCGDLPACSETGAECSDGVDNDGDESVDCADFDCWEAPACNETGPECSDGEDNDGDGDIDCADFDCDEAPACSETDAECADGEDNDGDGDIDCADFDCEEADACETGTAECTDGEDNDGDGDLDCDDYGCFTACDETDQCGDGVDNDGDGDLDCVDSECACDPVCTGEVPMCPDETLGSSVGDGVATGSIVADTCGTRSGASCGDGGSGTETEYRWVAPAAGTYEITTADTSAAGGTYDTILYVLDGSCTGDELACDDDGLASRLSTVTVTVTAGQVLIIVVDAYGTDEAGSFTLNINRVD